MADPKGFLTTPREEWPRRPVEERVRDWNEVYVPGALLPIVGPQAALTGVFARFAQGTAIRLESRLCETGFTRWASNPASLERRRSTARP